MSSRRWLKHDGYNGDGRAMPQVIGGRYGLSSKEFTPAMAARVFDELGRRTTEAAFHDRHLSTT